MVTFRGTPSAVTFCGNLLWWFPQWSSVVHLLRYTFCDVNPRYTFHSDLRGDFRGDLLWWPSAVIFHGTPSAVHLPWYTFCGDFHGDLLWYTFHGDFLLYTFRGDFCDDLKWWPSAVIYKVIFCCTPSAVHLLWWFPQYTFCSDLPRYTFHGDLLWWPSTVIYTVIFCGTPSAVTFRFTPSMVIFCGTPSAVISTVISSVTFHGDLRSDLPQYTFCGDLSWYTFCSDLPQYTFRMTFCGTPSMVHLPRWSSMVRLPRWFPRYVFDWLMLPITANHITSIKNLICIKSWFFSPPPLKNLPRNQNRSNRSKSKSNI